MKSLQKDLSSADKEISVRAHLTTPALFSSINAPSFTRVCPQSLKKKVEFLQKTLSTPTRTNEALSRLVFERCVLVSFSTSVLGLDATFLKTGLFTRDLFLQPGSGGNEATAPPPACRQWWHWSQYDLWHHNSRQHDPETNTDLVEEDASRLPCVRFVAQYENIRFYFALKSFVSATIQWKCLYFFLFLF